MTWEQSKQAADQLWRQLKDTYGIETAEMVVKALFRQVRPKPPKPSHVALAETIANDLMICGDDVKVDRLVLKIGERSVGGWVEKSLTDRIAKHLAEQK